MEDKKVVLAIDDNVMLLELFQKMLDFKYTVRTAESASTALYFLNSNKADIILLDI